MTPAELRSACITLYGDRGWQDRLAADLEVDPSTVRRWSSGAVPVPGPAAAAIHCFLKTKPKGKR